RAELEAAVHIDTGMSRLGLPGEELSLLASEWRKRLEGLRVVLWVSHLACAGELRVLGRRAARQGLRFRHGASRHRPLWRQCAERTAESLRDRRRAERPRAADPAN